jgi:C4-dicarboxylate-specific signal transduction histidine kinase
LVLSALTYQAITMLGELSSSLAHELNQPLGAILCNAEAAELFLQEPSPDLEELRAIMADIRKDDQRAGAVISRMRSLLKRREVEHSPLDLNLLTTEVISLIHPDADARKVRLALEPVSSLPPVRGDRVQLQQVLLNLLLKAMDAVNDLARDGHQVTVRVQLAGQQVEVSVSDTGNGIPADKLTRVFEPFFTTKPNGMGMGPPMSRTIVEAHGGRIQAKHRSTTGSARARLRAGYNHRAGADRAEDHYHRACLPRHPFGSTRRSKSKDRARQRRNTLTNTRTSPIQAAVRMRRASRRWTTKWVVWWRNWTRKAFATTR